MASLSIKYGEGSNSDKYGRGNKCSSLNSPVILKKFSRSQKLRAEALGWDGWMKEPFETNQSLLSNFQFFVPDNQDKMEDFSANKINFIPFDHDQICNQSHHHLTVNAKELPLNDNFVKSVPNLSSSVLLETNSSYFSTRKAIFTISLPSSQILVVNFAACQLLNYRSDELCSMKLENLIYEPYQHKWVKLKKDFFKDSFNIPYSNGKLIELVQNNGLTIVVSLYLKKLDNPQKCLVIAEPLDQKVAAVTIDHKGKILSYDEDTCFLFQYDASELIGVNICTLLPAINFNDYSEHHCRETFKQYITGRTKNQDNFPVGLTVNCINSDSEIFQIVIWVYLSLNGLFFVNKDLLLTNCNHYFIKFLFGYSKKEVINQSILNIIPSFGKDIRFDKMKSDHSESRLKTISNEDVYNNVYWGRDDSYQEICDVNESKINSATARSKNHSSSQELIVPLQNNSSAKTLYLQNEDEKIENDLTNENRIYEGTFFGFGKHKDGTSIDIKYQIKSTTLNEEIQYCVYLCRDLQKFEEIRKTMSTTMASSFNSTSFDSSLPDESIGSEQHTRPSPASVISQCDEILTAGEYCKHYTNIRQIGKGTFGYVKMAFRNSDGLLVVTKFIKKQKINIQSWVYHPNLNMKIPLEISLLITLQHPNIVKVIDVFHNESFVQLVMEKHGAGFDLFEFIDRGPNCDEKLKSYIFRQIVSAVHYLDSLGILHRDIKDENVIIDEKFQVKLIDFGSAAFMPPNETFSKFYGTMEYCSPEVLLGNNYRGPELEIWSLGVTLYVLTFGDNPFYNVEETVKGKFSIPSAISKELNDLLHRMLDKNIETRITIKKLAENEWINQPVCIENYKFEEVVRCYEDEAYPPKYVSEIHLDEFFSRRNSQTDSEKIFDKTNSSNSLQNITMDDFIDPDDSFQESFKAAKIGSAQQRKNLSPVMLFSTPLQKKDFRLSKSAVALRKRLEHSLLPKDSSSAKAEGNPIESDASVNITKLKRFNKSSPNLLDFDVSKKSDNSLDSTNLELEIRFKRCYFEGVKDEENLVDNQSKYSLGQDDYLEDNEETSDEQLGAEAENTSQCFSPN